MKKLLVLLFSLFFLSSTSVFADDIYDLQIEGISIGDSLLDYFSEKKIQDHIKKNYYKNSDTKFVPVEFWNENLKKYDVLSAYFKANDKTYTIYRVSGAILFDGNISDCYFEKNKIDNELNLLFGNDLRFDSGRQFHFADETNQSTYDRVDYEFPSGNSIAIICYDWSEAKGYNDHLSVGIETKEFASWLNSL